MTGIIIEHAFISNPTELGKYLSTEAKLKALGRADAKGIGLIIIIQHMNQ